MEKKQCQTKVKVVVRVRPLLSVESQTCVSTAGNIVQIVNHKNTSESLLYGFSSVYDQTSSQYTIFSECVEPLIDNVFKGQNVSIFAYGPTGAGKTHTMLGVVNDPGIIPRVIKSLFKKIATENETTSPPTVTFSYLEIYNEKVQDLLSPSSSDLPIREDASHNIFVAGITENVIHNFEEFRNCFGPASSNRTVAATNLNENSSRSHCILQLKVIRKAEGKTYFGKIYLIDLAGSEDNRRTGNRGIRLKESGAINKSLFVLGEVVDAINNNLIRVPYRNSKLTRLLQDTVGGTCHSVMITNIAPEEHYYYDTYCTLNFATKSKKVVNVNRAVVKPDTLPMPVKPTVKLQPTKRRKSLSAAGDSKKPKRQVPDSSSKAAPDTTQSSETVIPSTLVHHQAELEFNIHEKLDAVQKALQDITRIKEELTSHIATSRRSSSQTSYSTHTSSHRFSQSTSSRRCSSRLSGKFNDSPDVICVTPGAKGLSKLSDTTNLMAQRFLRRDEHSGLQPAKNKLKLKKKVEVDYTSCSPLFPAQMMQKRKSTGEEETKCSPRRKKAKAAASVFHNKEQLKRDIVFIELLNRASVKELQQLQTVGKKRAQLIFDWRQLQGPFINVDGLSQVPGFTEKFIKNLLRSNLILYTDE